MRRKLKNKRGVITSHTSYSRRLHKNEFIKLKPTTILANEKHGSGCVLSSAITANLALGFDTITSCKKAKIYIEKFLHSRLNPFRKKREWFEFTENQAMEVYSFLVNDLDIWDYKVNHEIESKMYELDFKEN